MACSAPSKQSLETSLERQWQGALCGGLLVSTSQLDLLFFIPSGPRLADPFSSGF